MAVKPKKTLIRIFTGILISIAWLCGLAFRITRSIRSRSIPCRIVLLISRPQDVELLIDVYGKARHREDVSPSFWMLKKCDRRFPGVLPLLKDQGVAVEQFVSYGGLFCLLNKLVRSDAFLNTVESTAAKHKLPYILTRMANAAGLSTYTLQHGFENIGLTYCDKIHGPEVKFSAKTIFTWCPVDELPDWVSKETINKAIAVGSPKNLVIMANNPAVNNGERPIIGVFDNLHWHRYNESYCFAFIRDLKEISEKRKEFRFILKSHPLSIRRRSKGLASLLKSINTVDVADLMADKSLTTPWLLSKALAVITTPSTIALDGAMAGVPVAVSRYGLDLDYYTPLCFLDKLEDWQDFLDCLDNEQRKDELKYNGERFLRRVLDSGDSTKKIIDLIIHRHRAVS